jgi:hypothetical protein
MGILTKKGTTKLSNQTRPGVIVLEGSANTAIPKQPSPLGASRKFANPENFMRPGQPKAHAPI